MSEQERLRDKIIEIKDEICIQIQNSERNIRKANLSNLFELTDQLDVINRHSNLPNIGAGVKTLIDNIRMRNLTITELNELKKTTQKFIGILSR